VSLILFLLITLNATLFLRRQSRLHLELFTAPLRLPNPRRRKMIVLPSNAARFVMQTEELSANVITLSPNVLKKLLVFQEELGADDLNAVIDKSLNIAHFVTETLVDPKNKLLIERNGRLQEFKGFA